MISEISLSKYFLEDVVNIACHVLNEMVIRTILENKAYVILKGRKHNISYFCVFSCKSFILNNRKVNFGKFDAKSDKRIFLGYSPSSKTYIMYNLRTFVFEELVHVAFDKTRPQKSGKCSLYDVSKCDNKIPVNDDTPKEDPLIKEDNKDDKVKSEQEEEKQETKTQLPRDWILAKDRSLDQILDDIGRSIEFFSYAFLSNSPKIVQT